MPTPIDRAGLRRLMDDDIRVVELLDEEQYDARHLPGAINIPLGGLGPQAVSDLDRGTPIVVYCWDGL